MNITIIGPNLAKQDKGEFHVHADGCADITRDPKRYGYRQAGPHMYTDAKTYEAVAEAVYEDHMAEHPEGSDLSKPEAYLSEFHFAPCCDGELKHRPDVTQGEALMEPTGGAGKDYDPSQDTPNQEDDMKEAKAQLERQYKQDKERAKDELLNLRDEAQAAYEDIVNTDGFVRTSPNGHPLFDSRKAEAALARLAASREAVGTVR